jgi:hypothetical protein
MFESASAYEPLFAAIGHDFGREPVNVYAGGLTWTDYEFNKTSGYRIIKT